MLTLTSLWQPVVVSAVLVFIASSIIWMALPIHKNDYKKLEGKEEGARDLARGLAAGVYMFPWCTPQDEKSDPAAAERLQEGPWGTLSVLPRRWSMGPMLGLWFGHLLIVSFFVAYITRPGNPAGTPYLEIFRVSGAAALVAHAGGIMPACIWQGQPWSQARGRLFDAVVYALITAGVFGWLWPRGA